MISEILDALPNIHKEHSRSSQVYQLLDLVAKKAIKESALNLPIQGAIDLGKFGKLNFPYHKMGAIDTLDLFGLDELIIFSLYWKNRGRYKRAADIGANLGLHSILMSRCGWLIDAYEPDPIHINLLKHNLSLNSVNNVQIHEAAVSDKAEKLEFVRVLGNTTGSHLAGAKLNPYGDLERFEVEVEPINLIVENADFVKLDAEGQEKIIILGIDAQHWLSTDMIVEIGSPQNAVAIFKHLTQLNVNIFSQKLGWQKASTAEEVPSSYKEGSAFITMKSEMPWSS